VTTPHPSWTILSERLAELPAAIARASHAALPEAFVSLDRDVPVVATGGGLSEGPARVLVALLQRAGRTARFVPQSAFSIPSAPADPRALLVMFSQGLAPNARLPLPHVRSFARSLLVTSVRSGAHLDALHAAGGLAWTLPPVSEDRLLLRVVGPGVSLVAALRIAAALAPTLLEGASFEGLAAVVTRALLAPASDLFGDARRPIVIIGAPQLVDIAMPLRWKLLEGLRVGDPPVWDPLQFAHGPLQSVFEERTSFVFLRSASDASDELFARVREVLARAASHRHRIVELRASLAAPLALVELDALLDAALLTTLVNHPLPLDEWPSRGEDGPLYDLSPDAEGAKDA
jgi:creatinine amidohydrolase